MSIYDTACMAYPQFRQQIEVIRFMPLATRSVLIKACQAQCVPDHTTPLGSMIRKLPSFHVYPGNAALEQQMTPIRVFRDMSSLITKPVTSAIILDLCRSLPLPQAEIDAARLASWWKEGIKIQEEERPCQINWEPCFDPSKSNESMLPFLSPNPAMAQYIFSCLFRLRSKVRKLRRLYPRHTHKNMSRATRREFEASTGVSLEDTPLFTQDHYLNHYHRTGELLGGETEMRQRWYQSAAKPRTYFAQGGEHYRDSMHLQDFFTDLVNSCTPVHHIFRLQPSRLQRREGQHYRVYDLATFTSNLAEQRGFVRRLAQFFVGVEVEIFDFRHGFITCDLGDLLYQYYDSCVYHPSVSYERIRGVPVDETGIHISDHGVASMLGIFGNLMTCTFAHGALLLQTVENEDYLNVAGDDGLVYEDDSNRNEVHWAIQTLGEYERTKTFNSADEGAICLKRPLTEVLGGLELEINCVPPSLVVFAWNIFGITDIRYRVSSSTWGHVDNFSVVGKDLIRFLRSVHRWQWKLSDDQVQVAIDVACNWTRVAFKSGGGECGLVHSGDPYMWPDTHISVADLRSYDPVYLLLLRRYKGHCRVSVREVEEVVPLTSDIEVGDVLRCNSRFSLSALTLLGYVRRERVEKVLYGVEGFEYILRLFVDPEPVVYQYTVLQPIPPMFYLL